MIYIAAGIRSGTRIKQNYRASGWLEIANALPAGMRLVALDSAPRPPLGAHGPSALDDAFYDHPNVLDLTGETESIHHAAALIERCSAFVGVDSALLHVAHALGKPVQVLCAAAPMEARLPIVGQGDGFEGGADCFPCQYRTPCPERSHCLDWVKGEWVAKKIGEMV